ncbi:MAG: carbohydrate-binding domain-containing protein [Clostridia bacterium]|nr:carbohydrate-binding domain-containing protein [Clostridia bacterium]
MKDKKLIIVIVVLALILIGMIVVAVVPFRSKNNIDNSNTTAKIEEDLDLNITNEINSDWDEENSTVITLSGNLNITKAGTYHLTGTIENGSVNINVGDNDTVTLVLDNVNITNSNGSAIYVENADEVIITALEGTTNTLTDGGTSEEIDGCIYSKDDLVINGKGTLNIVANNADGIVSKDDLKIYEVTINVTANDDGIRGKDSLEMKNANIKLNVKQDGIKATEDTDTSKGYIIIENSNIEIQSGDDGIHAETNLKISGGTYNIVAGDDGIHANGMCQIDDGTFDITATEGIEATYVKINGGTIKIAASDDGINAGNKSDNYSVVIEINGGDITINMGQGDTDGIDSNGSLYINGGTINITGNSPFDYDGEAKLNGGTLIVNGEETDTITNQFMGGGMPGGMNPGGMQRMR